MVYHRHESIFHEIFTHPVRILPPTNPLLALEEIANDPSAFLSAVEDASTGSYDWDSVTGVSDVDVCPDGQWAAGGSCYATCGNGGGGSHGGGGMY